MFKRVGKYVLKYRKTNNIRQKCTIPHTSSIFVCKEGILFHGGLMEDQEQLSGCHFYQ